MNIYKRNTKLYRKVWSAYYNQNIPNGWHIHHLDGNCNNNDISNLICVSPYVHWCIHFLQGDQYDFIKNSSENAIKGGMAYSKKYTGKSRGKMSKEHRDKISRAMKGKKKTADHILAASTAHRYKNRKYIVSEETKLKLSISAKEFWKKRKAEANSPHL